MATPHITEPAGSGIPLCVDLDGTLIRTDLLWESLFAFAGHSPEKLGLVFGWLLKGKAQLKKKLAESVDLNVAYLPYNATFVEWLVEQRAAGRRLVLATASDEILAHRVAAHLGIFDELLASNGTLNLKGRNKAKVLHQRFGGAFDYAGNSAADWEIWRECRQIIAVDTSGPLTRRLAKTNRLTDQFHTAKSKTTVWLRALRLHQWIKNILIFLPIIAAHKALDRDRLLPTVIAFFAFSLAASASYLGNDLVDLAADRIHPRKRFRPIAAGDVRIPAAAAASVALFAAGVALAADTGSLIVAALVFAYALTSFTYSMSLKKIALLDVYTLSGLYTARIVVGSAAGRVPLSGWFLSFSIFLFLSLGFAKRAAELHRVIIAHAPPQVPGRGYSATDFLPVMCFGIASAFAAALVLALYMQSAIVQALYRHPQLLWAIFPICLYWLTRVWLLAERGELQEDPISFAVKDRTTWLLLALCGIILKLAA
jgi:4-hydroxybenzoate polyprenyltransferase